MNISPSFQRELKALMHAGLKVKAIKLLYERTDCGLAEAKEYVESIDLTDEWSLVAPTKPGYYWFYGRGCHPIVRVSIIQMWMRHVEDYGESEGVNYTFNGFDAGDIAPSGLYLPIQEPEIPTMPAIK